GVSVGFDAKAPNAGVRIEMAGSDVFKYAVKALDSVVEETLEANGLDRHDIDWLIPHQANLRIIEATAKRLDMPMERVIVTVDRHGNTSSGSVPLALDEAVRSGKVQRGQLLLLEAFGGGCTWGSALLRYGAMQRRRPGRAPRRQGRSTPDGKGRSGQAPGRQGWRGLAQALRQRAARVAHAGDGLDGDAARRHPAA